MCIVRLLSFNDLKDRGIVKNRMTLKRYTDDLGFPPGFMLSGNSRRWLETDVNDWVATRLEASSAIDATKKAEMNKLASGPNHVSNRHKAEAA